ncbi:MAG: preprotein translocase subunit SecE [Coxiellaceae bacterium]|nr:preprotein translocase subunit SecE [Coxiellaceae bacterium]
MAAPSSKVAEPTKGMDIAKWLLVFILLAGGVVANYYYTDTVAWAIRLAIGIVVGCAVLGIAATTTKGQVAWGFVKAARNELRKVVWPTRDETIKTTAMVVVMVLVTALVLWGLDAFFMWLISLIAGQRG